MRVAVQKYNPNSKKYNKLKWNTDWWTYDLKSKVLNK